MPAGLLPLPPPPLLLLLHAHCSSHHPCLSALAWPLAAVGDARVGLVGFPSVGKSTLLTKITGTFSEAAGYGAWGCTCARACVCVRVACACVLSLLVRGVAPVAVPVSGLPVPVSVSLSLPAFSCAHTWCMRAGSRHTCQQHAAAFSAAVYLIIAPAARPAPAAEFTTLTCIPGMIRCGPAWPVGAAYQPACKTTQFGATSHHASMRACGPLHLALNLVHPAQLRFPV